jgi:hypothetical protein
MPFVTSIERLAREEGKGWERDCWRGSLWT